ncbi:MarR family winged helix-turn-helix transcriptional regulator [uncultured Methanobrevibacter sp.]|uniref:MarR family winged helix-turn-helix transcriptional regulator n=1 Tax=uncultured Methanobrevibacter sp. TaxID=253161 RepID=UPI0025D9D53D|nr:MarR family transcriptional regulator [uncultured Methanobrevibacter sp.]
MDLNSNNKNRGKSEINQQEILDIYSLDNNELDNVPIGFFFGLVARQYLDFFDKYLSVLCQEQNISQERIASLLRVNGATVTRELENLEKRNLIMRKMDENDRRRKLVSLYDKGFEMLESFRDVDWETESKLLKYFSIEELHILKFLLKKIIIRIEDIQK